ncbi:hypothetical protein [Streptomyces sp. NBC_00443]|uniref:hypothetical protein n=1 Tax=Streptomyces sp. NBC_00443 TaxID=2975743 RepID=UPI002E23E4FD
MHPGETVLVTGPGPADLMAAQSAFAMAASRVLGADLVAERRAFAGTLEVEPVEGDDARTVVRENDRRTRAGRPAHARLTSYDLVATYHWSQGTSRRQRVRRTGMAGTPMPALSNRTTRHTGRAAHAGLRHLLPDRNRDDPRPRRHEG